MVKNRPKGSMATVGEDFDLDGDTVASRDDVASDGELQALAPGSQAGRYMILSELGRGGMGVVYKAYDPELDRRVALKLLSVKGSSASQGDRARERLLREARALAQLSHPNVVSAYDVGTLGEDVFVAMELVEGKTLKEWIRDEQPTVWQKVQVITAAGFGIAAAHQAGLVHRDVKPDNIIVGDDGRVRVLDFGLARAALSTENGEKQEKNGAISVSGDPRQAPLMSADLTSGGGFFSSPVTLAGAIVGTPGYMAPEQYLGDAVDEKTDQYAFCVTLHEALYGQRPVVAKKYRDLKKKVLQGKTDPLPSGPKVPARYRRIGMRGMAVAKEDRYPSMQELLAELSKDPRVARRRLLAMVAVVVLVLGSFTGAYAWQAQKQRLCAGAQEKMTGAWDRSVAQKVKAKFVASGRPYAGDTFDRVKTVLDGYSRQWVAMRTEACEATHLLGEQSQLLLDRRMGCLDRRLGELKALSDLFAAQADAKVVDRAVPAAFGLISLKACADADALLAAVPPPEDPVLRAQVESLRVRLAEVSALGIAGKYKQGLPLAKSLVEESMDLPYAPIRAETFYSLGALNAFSGDSKAAQQNLTRAIQEAARAKNSELKAKAATKLIYVTGYQQAEQKVAVAISELALADVIQAGDDPILRANVLRNVGLILSRNGKYEQARGKLEQALALREREFGSDHPEVVDILGKLGDILMRQGKKQKARSLFQRELAVKIKAFGSEHYQVAISHIALGNVQSESGELQEALVHYRRARQIMERAVGTDNPDVAAVISNIGLIYSRQGKFEPALENFLQALDIKERTQGTDNPNLAFTLNSLGTLYNKQGKYQLAQETCRRALKLTEHKFDPKHPFLSYLHQCMGEAFIGQRQPAQAIVWLERALAIRQANPNEVGAVAETRFVLAQALWELRRDRQRAVGLVRQARAVYAEMGDKGKQPLAQLDQWSARVRLPAK